MDVVLKDRGRFVLERARSGAGRGCYRTGSRRGVAALTRKQWTLTLYEQAICTDSLNRFRDWYGQDCRFRQALVLPPIPPLRLPGAQP